MNPYVTEAANKDLKNYVKNEVKKDKSCHTVMSFGISWMLLMNVQSTGYRVNVLHANL